MRTTRKAERWPSWPYLIFQNGAGVYKIARIDNGFTEFEYEAQTYAEAEEYVEEYLRTNPSARAHDTRAPREEVTVAELTALRDPAVSSVFWLLDTALIVAEAKDLFPRDRVLVFNPAVARDIMELAQEIVEKLRREGKEGV